MVKLVYCVRKRDDVSDDEFHRYWLEQHGPFVCSFAEAIAAVRYVQSHTILPEANARLQAGRGLAAPYEGTTEVWWNSLEDLAAALQTTAGIEADQGPCHECWSRVRLSRLRATRLPGNAGSFTPDREGLVAAVSVFSGGNEMTAGVEGVVGRRV